jgi:hypothetical protein
MKRWQFDKALTASSLPGLTKLILHTLAARANWPSGRIPDEFSPSLTKLAALASMSRRAVMTHLNAAEELGWVKRGRPSPAAAIADKECTSYVLSIPDG